MSRIRSITLEGQTVQYALYKRRGQRQLALSVHADGRVTLTVPKWVPIRTADSFLREKQMWVLAALAKIPTHKISSPAANAIHYRKHKEQARAFVQQRLAELNEHYNLSYNRVAIRNNVSRWGSCSEHRNLNFDYRVLFLAPHLQDYLLVHELCHLKEMNHSPRFWALVAEVVPEHHRCRKEMHVARVGMQSMH